MRGLYFENRKRIVKTMMKRLTNKSALLVTTALTSLLGTACVHQSATETVQAVESAETIQPNIVHIFTDDLGWQDIACYYRAIHGEEAMYETPHMDRLAKNGKRFMQAYSPAPTCAPSCSRPPSGHRQ